MRQATIVTLLFAASAVAGCDRILTGEPAVQNLVGVYRLSPASETFLRVTKRYKTVPVSEVELKPDYRISIRGLPDCATDRPLPHLWGKPARSRHDPILSRWRL